MYHLQSKLKLFLNSIVGFLNEQKDNIVVLILYFFISFLFFIVPIYKNLLIAHGDGFSQYLPYRMIISKFVTYGPIFYFPYQFGGLDFLGTMQTGLLYPLNFIYLFLSFPKVFNFSVIFHYFLGAYFMFIYLRSLKYGRNSSFVGGFLFAFTGFLQAHRGHISTLNSAIWLPFILYSFKKAEASDKPLYFSLLSIGISLQILAGYFQVCVYTYIVIFIHLFFIKNKEYKKYIKLIVFILLGFLIASPQLYATLEISKYAFRNNLGFNFFTEFSTLPFTFIQYILPFLFGGLNQIPVWAGNYITENSGYMSLGAFIIALISIASFNKSKNNTLTPWFILIIVGLFLSMGRYTPLYHLMEYVPVYNLFRVPARNIFYVSFALIIFFTYLFDKLISSGNDALKLRFKKIFTISLIIVIGFIFVISSLRVLSYPDIDIYYNRGVDILSLQGKEIFSQIFSPRSPTIFIPVLISILLLLITNIFFNKKLIKIWLALFMLVSIFDSHYFSINYDAHWPSIAEYNKKINNGITNFLKTNSVGSRVFIVWNKEDPNLFPAYSNIQMINGYEPFMPKNIHEYLNMVQNGVSLDLDSLLINNTLLSMLNVKYIVLPKNYKLPINPTIESDLVPTKIKYNLNEGKNWFLQNASWSDNYLKISSEKFGKLGLATYKFAFKPGVYSISLKIKSKKRLQQLVTVDLYGDNLDIQKNKMLILPYDVGFVNKTFSKIFYLNEKEASMLDRIRFINPNDTDIEINEIVVERFDDYSIPSLNHKKGMSAYSQVYHDTNYQIIENNNVMGRVFSINNLKNNYDISKFKSGLLTLSINPSKTAIVQNKPTSIAVSNSIEIKDYKENNNSFYFTVTNNDSKNHGFVVITNQYSNYWKAYINGKKIDTFNSDGGFLGAFIPPNGSYKIVFKYQPQYLYLIAISIIIITFLLVFAIRKPGHLSN